MFRNIVCWFGKIYGYAFLFALVVCGVVMYGFAEGKAMRLNLAHALWCIFFATGLASFFCSRISEKWRKEEEEEEME